LDALECSALGKDSILSFLIIPCKRKPFFAFCAGELQGAIPIGYGHIEDCAVGARQLALLVKGWIGFGEDSRPTDGFKKVSIAEFNPVVGAHIYVKAVFFMAKKVIQQNLFAVFGW